MPPKAKPAAAPAKNTPARRASRDAAKSKARTSDEHDSDSKKRKGAAAGSSGRDAKKAKTAVSDDVSAALPDRTKRNSAAAAAAAKPAPRKKSHVELGKKINDPPKEILDVYVFGEGSAGELGLGSKIINGKKPINVKRPRLNENLSASSVGVVQVACGGMHAAALTRDNRILTWGVNDLGALGRDTTWDGGMVDVDDADDSDDEIDGTGMNPYESTPTAVSSEHFADGVVFVQIVASDSATFVLTEDGRVYGWGTFRSSDGILGFNGSIEIRKTPLLLEGMKNIKALAAGTNHILALDHKGNVLAWGCGQQNQLGRRIIERNKMSSLVPQGLGLPRGKITRIACGSYHSFAVDTDGKVWGWGLNNFGELGVDANAGEDDAVVLKPVKVDYLNDYDIVDIDGGEHHSLACSSKGELLTWGRVDGYQVGFELDQLSEKNAIYDERGNPRILFKPTPLPDVSNIVSVAAGTDNSFAVSRDGKAYSWGFSTNYQCGQGNGDEIHTPTLIDNTAVRDKKMIGAGAGGQFSILFGKAEGPKTNGVNGVHA